MPQPIRMPNLGPRPVVRTSAQWGRRARSLNRDPAMQRLAHRHWARCSDSVPEPMDPLQRAALLQTVLDCPDSQVRLTGLSALELYGLPIGEPDERIDELLGHAPPPKGPEYAKMLFTPHFSWVGERLRTPVPDVVVTKSFGLDRYPGPWGTWLADPIEALVVAASFLPGGESQPAWTHSCRGTSWRSMEEVSHRTVAS